MERKFKLGQRVWPTDIDMMVDGIFQGQDVINTDGIITEVDDDGYERSYEITWVGPDGEELKRCGYHNAWFESNELTTDHEQYLKDVKVAQEIWEETKDD